MAGTLYLVGTPIGNLEDITARALRVLSEVGFIACEDTRRSRGLLTHFGISRPLVSVPAFAEGVRTGPVLDRIQAGEDCAFITDAGMPGISDPGEKLVAEALARGIPVVPIPGPSAILAALSASGLPSDRFCFLGFLPRKGTSRAALLEEAGASAATAVLFEAPNRLAETLAELAGAWGDRRACVARELTKLHEELIRGKLAELAERFVRQPARGEVVLVVEGRPAAARWTQEEVRRAVEAGLARGERLKELSAQVARASGWAGKEVYRLGLKTPRS